MVAVVKRMLKADDSKWWVRDLGIAFMVAILVGGLSLLGQKLIDDERALRDARVENLRFIRDISVSATLAETRAAADVVDEEAAADDFEARRYTPLSGLDLKDQNLAGLTLPRADLSRSMLSGVDFTSADLTDADLSNTTMTSARIVSATMPEADINYANLDDAELTSSNFRKAQFNLTSARNLNRGLESYSKNDFSGAQFLGSDFTGSDLSQSDFTAAFFDGTVMREVNLRGAIFAGALVRDVDLTGSNLDDVDFSTVDFQGVVQLTGVCWTETTRWPEGSELPPGKVDSCDPLAGNAWRP
ncbi:pentapeptide repeat-containing protein [Cryobacterium sp. TMT2-4]|nr:pentapeptide repeat-containing protein [Cryobacterium sp. TMT2-4]